MSNPFTIESTIESGTSMKLTLRRNAEVETDIGRHTPLLVPLVRMVTDYVGHEPVGVEGTVIVPHTLPVPQSLTLRSDQKIDTACVVKLLAFLSQTRSNQSLFDCYLGRMTCTYTFAWYSSKSILTTARTLDQAFQFVGCKEVLPGYLYSWSDPKWTLKVYTAAPGDYELIRYEDLTKRSAYALYAGIDYQGNG